jgi:hypothetical protein
MTFVSVEDRPCCEALARLECGPHLRPYILLIPACHFDFDEPNAKISQAHIELTTSSDLPCDDRTFWNLVFKQLGVRTWVRLEIFF